MPSSDHGLRRKCPCRDRPAMELSSTLRRSRVPGARCDRRCRAGLPVSPRRPVSPPMVCSSSAHSHRWHDPARPRARRPVPLMASGGCGSAGPPAAPVSGAPLSARARATRCATPQPGPASAFLGQHLVERGLRDFELRGLHFQHVVVLELIAIRRLRARRHRACNAACERPARAVANGACAPTRALRWNASAAHARAPGSRRRRPSAPCGTHPSTTRAPSSP